MKRITFIFVLLIFSYLSIFSQDLRKKAEESPLDCYFYLLWKDDARNDSKVQRLALIYFQLERFDDFVSTVNFLEPSTRVEIFTFFSTKLLETNKEVKLFDF